MVKPKGKYKALETRLGYEFRDPSLLDLALRHSSVGTADNQRLEFLGDRVLGLVIAEALYKEFPHMSEGELAPRYNYLIRKTSCARIAEHLKLGDELQLGRSEAKSGGRRKNSLLGDVMEAVIGAIYLDAGHEIAKQFILLNWTPMIHKMPEETVDAKTRLQEYFQAHKHQPPEYKVVSREGPDHAPIFTVECTGFDQTAVGTGPSKRIAEQHAAHAMLDKLEDNK